MKTIDFLSVKQTYQVQLEDIQVPDEVYDGLIEIFDGLGGYAPEADRASGNVALAVDWLSDHIKENDAHEWESEILDME